MKKFMSVAVAGLLVLSTGALSFADDVITPAEIYAEQAGVSLEETYGSRGEARFGQMAKDAGIWEEFNARFLEVKKEKIGDLVKAGDMTQAEADEIIAAMEACDGTNPEQLLLGKNLAFGRGSEGNNGRGFGAKSSNGLRDGSGSENGFGLRDGSGARRGGRFNQE